MGVAEREQSSMLFITNNCDLPSNVDAILSHLTYMIYLWRMINYLAIFWTVIADTHTDLTDRFGINDNQSFFEFHDGDGSLEQLLWTIENVHSRVHKLKSQVNVIMSKNALKFSSSENLNLLLPHGDLQTSSAHSPTFSAGNGDTLSAGAIYNSAHHVPEFDFGDLVMPDSAVSSYGEVTTVPDIIESTVGLLSAADVTLHQPQTGDSCEDVSSQVFCLSNPDQIITIKLSCAIKHHLFGSLYL